MHAQGVDDPNQPVTLMRKPHRPEPESTYPGPLTLTLTRLVPALGPTLNLYLELSLNHIYRVYKELLFPWVVYKWPCGGGQLGK
jgi:hypothetical protein